jgi:hypothetical protein
LVVLIFLVVYRGDRDGIRSVRDSIRSLQDAIVKEISGQTLYLHDLSRLSTIETKLGRIEALMQALEKREEKREREKQARRERLTWHDLPSITARRTNQERLEALKQFVEHSCGGCVVVADVPSAVWFTLPFDNNDALIKKLEGNDLIGTTGETVQARPDMFGRGFVIDLASLGDDELDRITCLRTSAWPGPASSRAAT